MAWNVGSLGVLGLSGIALNVVIGRWAGAAALGVFNQAYAIYIFASQLAVGGLQFSVLHYVSWRPDERREVGEISSSALALAALLSLAVAAAVAAGRGLAAALLDSPAVGRALLAVAPGLVFFSLNKVLLAVLNALAHMRAFAVFQSLRFALILGGVVGILAAGLDPALLAGAFSLAEAALAVVLGLYVVLRAAPLGPRRVRRSWLARHGVFGWKSFLSGTLSELNTRVDVLCLGFFLSDRLVGVYSFAAILAEGFNQLPYVVRNNLDPLIGNRFADGQRQRIEHYARRVRRVFWPAMAAAGLAGVLVYPWLLRLLFDGGGDFAASGGVFAILVLGVVVSAGHRPFLGVLAQGGRPEAYTLLVTLVVAGNLAGNLLAIPFLGIHGAALATAAMLVAESALLVVFARRLFALELWR